MDGMHLNKKTLFCPTWWGWGEGGGLHKQWISAKRKKKLIKKSSWVLMFGDKDLSGTTVVPPNYSSMAKVTLHPGRLHTQYNLFIPDFIQIQQTKIQTNGIIPAIQILNYSFEIFCQSSFLSELRPNWKLQCLLFSASKKTQEGPRSKIGPRCCSSGGLLADHPHSIVQTDTERSNQKVTRGLR